MRTPDQNERPDPGTADDALGDGFGSVDPGDLNDGYGTHDFYGDSYDAAEVDDTYDTDDTFDDAADDDGGFGGSDDTGAGGGGGDGVGSVVQAGGDAGEAEAENVLVDILDDVFGDDADEVVEDMEATYGMDASEILASLGDDYAVDDESGRSFVAADADDGGDVLDDNALDGQPDGGDVADFVTQSDFDLNTDGHVDPGDLHEAAHSLDFHVDGG
jgi:hypothetical protein